MPLFQYRAQDNQGRTIEGAVTADDAGSAQAGLVARGLRIFDLQERGGAPKQTVPAPPKPVQQPTITPPPIVNASQAPPRPVAGSRGQILLNSPAPTPRAVPAQPQRVNTSQPAPSRIVRTKRGTNKDNTFLFAQIASYLRSGVNPAEAFNQLAASHPKPWFRESLLEAAKQTSEGVRFSQVLARYPDLYEPGIVGMIRAGEEGGFLVEACDAVAEQTEAARRFAIIPTFVFWFSLVNLAFLPAIWMMVRAALHVWDVADAPGGGRINGARVLGQGIWQSILWPVGPVTLVLVLIGWLAHRWLMSLESRPMRHRLALKTPSVGKRAKAESIAIFAWTLSLVSRAGVAPRAAWALAVGAMPNIQMQAEMKAVGDRMQDGTKLSEAMRGTNLLPEEYSMIVQTGEMTGDVTSALQNASSASRDDFKRETIFAGSRICCWGLLALGIGFLVAFYLIYGVFYGHMFDKVLGGD